MINVKTEQQDPTASPVGWSKLYTLSDGELYTMDHNGVRRKLTGSVGGQYVLKTGDTMTGALVFDASGLSQASQTVFRVKKDETTNWLRMRGDGTLAMAKAEVDNIDVSNIQVADFLDVNGLSRFNTNGADYGASINVGHGATSAGWIITQLGGWEFAGLYVLGGTHNGKPYYTYSTHYLFIAQVGASWFWFIHDELIANGNTAYTTATARQLIGGTNSDYLPSASSFYIQNGAYTGQNASASYEEGSNLGISTNSIQVREGSGAGKILVSDASGKGSWNDPSVFNSNFITTTTAQTGLTGNKSTSGVWSFGGVKITDGVFTSNTSAYSNANSLTGLWTNATTFELGNYSSSTANSQFSFYNFSKISALGGLFQNNVEVGGYTQASQFRKTGGTSSQYLMADGSVKTDAESGFFIINTMSDFLYALSYPKTEKTAIISADSLTQITWGGNWDIYGDIRVIGSGNTLYFSSSSVSLTRISTDTARLLFDTTCEISGFSATINLLNQAQLWLGPTRFTVLPTISHTGGVNPARFSGYYIPAGGIYEDMRAESQFYLCSWQNGAGQAIQLTTDKWNTDITPSDTTPRIGYRVVNNSQNSLNDGGVYNRVIHVQAGGGGAGYSHQLGLTDNGNLWMRSGASGGTTWGAWKKIWSENNFDPATKANLSGASFSDTIAIRGTRDGNIGVIAYGGSSWQGAYRSTVDGTAGKTWTWGVYSTFADWVLNSEGVGNAITVNKTSLATTLSGALSGTSASFSSSLSQLNISATTSAGGVYTIQSLMPNLANSSSNTFNLGKAQSANNSALIAYNHASDGSTSNSLSLGLHTVGDILTLKADKSASFTGAVSAKAFVSGSNGLSTVTGATGNVDISSYGVWYHANQLTGAVTLNMNAGAQAGLSVEILLVQPATAVGYTLAYTGVSFSLLGATTGGTNTYTIPSTKFIGSGNHKIKLTFTTATMCYIEVT